MVPKTLFNKGLCETHFAETEAVLYNWKLLALVLESISDKIRFFSVGLKLWTGVPSGPGAVALGRLPGCEIHTAWPQVGMASTQASGRECNIVGFDGIAHSTQA
jgi:hypothetical protein